MIDSSSFFNEMIEDSIVSTIPIIKTIVGWFLCLGSLEDRQPATPRPEIRTVLRRRKQESHRLAQSLKRIDDFFGIGFWVQRRTGFLCLFVPPFLPERHAGFFEDAIHEITKKNKQATENHNIKQMVNCSGLSCQCCLRKLNALRYIIRISSVTPLIWHYVSLFSIVLFKKIRYNSTIVRSNSASWKQRLSI